MARTESAASAAAGPTTDDVLAVIDAVVERVKNEFGPVDIAVVLGSGLGKFGDVLENRKSIPFSEFEGFPRTSVVGHDGKLLYGTIGDRRLLCFSGRVHAYEGYHAVQLTFPARIAHKAGAKLLIVTNAAGGCSMSMQRGAIVLLRDYVSVHCVPPLGDVADDPRLGDAHAPTASPFSEPALRTARKVSAGLKLHVEEGVYFWTTGPTYETPAEIRSCIAAGAGCVGMSTVPEVAAARALGIGVLGMSLVTNMCAGLAPEELSHQDVKAEAEQAAPVVCELCRRIVMEVDLDEVARVAAESGSAGPSSEGSPTPLNQVAVIERPGELVKERAEVLRKLLAGRAVRRTVVFLPEAAAALVGVDARTSVVELAPGLRAAALVGERSAPARLCFLMKNWQGVGVNEARITVRAVMRVVPDAAVLQVFPAATSRGDAPAPSSCAFRVAHIAFRGDNDPASLAAPTMCWRRATCSTVSYLATCGPSPPTVAEGRVIASWGFEVCGPARLHEAAAAGEAGIGAIGGVALVVACAGERIELYPDAVAFSTAAVASALAEMDALALAPAATAHDDTEITVAPPGFTPLTQLAEPPAPVQGLPRGAAVAAIAKDLPRGSRAILLDGRVAAARGMEIAAEALGGAIGQPALLSPDAPMRCSCHVLGTRAGVLVVSPCGDPGVDVAFEFPGLLSRILRACGVRAATLVCGGAASALGSVGESPLRLGRIAVVRDHVNFAGRSSLTGPHDAIDGERFTDMGKAYDKDISQQLFGHVEEEHGVLPLYHTAAHLPTHQWDNAAALLYCPRALGCTVASPSGVTHVMANRQVSIASAMLLVAVKAQNRDDWDTVDTCDSKTESAACAAAVRAAAKTMKNWVVAGTETENGENAAMETESST